jgi:hypothetical protein
MSPSDFIYTSLYRYRRGDMKQPARAMTVILLLVCCEAMGCQSDNPRENVDTPADKAAEAIERAITTPIEKAKAVEGTLQRAADRTAEQTQKADE